MCTCKGDLSLDCMDEHLDLDYYDVDNADGTVSNQWRDHVRNDAQ